MTSRAWLALWTVYIVWGSTYLGIALAGETIPPIFAAGVRFLLTGALMGGFVALRRGRVPFRVRRSELGSAVLVGVLLLGANALLFVAERRVPIGLASLLIASVPLWIVLMRTATGDRPSRVALVGVATGFAGIAVLVRPAEARELRRDPARARLGADLGDRLLPLVEAAAARRRVRRDGARDARGRSRAAAARPRLPGQRSRSTRRRGRGARSSGSSTSSSSARSSATPPTCGCSPTSRSAPSRRTPT